MKFGVSKRTIPQKFKGQVPKLDLSHTVDETKRPRNNTDRNKSASKLLSPTNLTLTSRPSNLASPTNLSSVLFTEDAFDNRIDSLSVNNDFEKIRTLELTVERNKRTFENQLSYMQEYINFLRRKLGQAEEIDEEFKNFKQYKDLSDNLKDEVSYLNTILAKNEQEIRNYIDELCEKQGEIDELSKKVGGQAKVVHSLSSESTLNLEKEMKLFYEGQINELKIKCKELRLEAVNKEHDIEFLQGEAKKQEKMIIHKSIQGIENKVSEKVELFMQMQDSDFNTLTGHVEKLEERVKTLYNTLKVIQNTTGKVNGMLVSKLEQQVAEKSKAYEKLKDNSNKQASETERLKFKLADAQESTVEAKETNEKLKKIIEDLNSDLKVQRKKLSDLEKQKFISTEESKEIER